MLTASVETIASVTGGQLVAGSAGIVANDVCIDSRGVGPGCTFVGVRGEHVDGSDFALEALSRGARVLVLGGSPDSLESVVSAVEGRDSAVIRVPDGLLAFQSLAAYHRSRLHCEVVGITGSTGKTTTKDFVDAVLSTKLRVVSTVDNRNNEIGVPLTILRAGADTDVLVVEMGMRGAGQIERLCELSRPTVGLITNIGTSHIELLGSQDAVAAAKSELLRALPAKGAAFLNGDDAFSDAIAPASNSPVRFYGLSERCAVRAADIELDDASRASFELLSEAGAIHVTLPVPGRHNVYNALAAASVGLELDLSLDDIALGLASAALSAMRMQVFASASGVTVVNDAYNANPVSMRAALDTLAGMRVPGKRIAVLGDMAELGSLTELAHFEMGEQVAHLRIDELVTVGSRARRIAEGARAAGMQARHVRPCESVEEASEVLDDLIAPGDVVLVKASRVMGLEAVVEGIVNPR